MWYCSVVNYVLRMCKAPDLTPSKMIKLTKMHMHKMFCNTLSQKQTVQGITGLDNNTNMGDLFDEHQYS